MNNQELVQGVETKIWNSTFIKVFIINMLTQFCVYMSNTLSGLFADYLGAAATIVGLVSSLFALTALIFKIVSAPAIDAFDRKRVLIGSIGIMLLSFLFYFVSQSVPMLVVSRLIQGIGMAFVPTVCMTIASDSLPHEKMVTGIGYFAVGSAICWGIGPALGLYLKGILGYNLTFAILAVVMLLTIAFSMTLKNTYRPTKKFEITLDSVVAREAITPTVVLFFLSMAYSSIMSFLIIYGNLVLFGQTQVKNSEMGTFFTIYAITLIFSRPLIGKLADKFGTVKVAVPSMLAFIAAFIVISVSRSLPMFLVAGFIAAFGYGGVQPTMQAVCMKSVSKERRGAASCTSYIGMDVANLVGPVIAGSVVERFGSNIPGYSNMWLVMTIPIVFAMIVSIVFQKPITNAGKQFVKPETAA